MTPFSPTPGCEYFPELPAIEEVFRTLVECSAVGPEAVGGCLPCGPRRSERSDARNLRSGFFGATTRSSAGSSGQRSCP